MISRTSWFLSLAIYAYIVGVANFGYFSFYASIWIIIGKLTGFGIEIWIIKYVARNTHKRINNIPLDGLLIKVCAFAIFSIPVVICFLLDGSLSTELFALMILLGIRQFFEIIREYLVGILQGFQKMDFQTKATMPYDFIQLCGIALLYKFGQDNINILLAPFLITSFLKIISLNRAARKCGVWFLLSKRKKKTPIIIIGSSLPIGIMAITYNVVFQSQTIFLEFFQEISIVGAFGAAFLIISSIDILLGVFRQSFFPILVNQYKNNDPNFIKNLTKKFTYYLIFSITISMLITISAIIIDHFGLIQDYEKSLEILKYSSIVVIPALAANSFWGSAINATNLSKYAAKFIILLAIPTIPISLFLISYISWIGAIISIILFSVILSFIYANLVRKKLNDY